MTNESLIEKLEAQKSDWKGYAHFNDGIDLAIKIIRQHTANSRNESDGSAINNQQPVDIALAHAAEILANFKNTEPNSDATELDRVKRKLEEWQACYAMCFRQLNHAVKREPVILTAPDEEKLIYQIGAIMSESKQLGITGYTNEASAAIMDLIRPYLPTTERESLDKAHDEIVAKFLPPHQEIASAAIVAYQAAMGEDVEREREPGRG